MRCSFLSVLALLSACGEPAVEGVGEVVQDFTAADSAGVEYRLHDFEGRVVLVEISAMWCPGCQELAPHTQELYETYGNDDFEILGVIFDNSAGDDPTPANLDNWTNTFGLTHPVLGDVGEAIQDSHGGAGQPTGLLIDRDLTVVWKATGSDVIEGIDAQLAELL